ncbi:hypothetical protein, partial [Serratia marcescens]|uniref:hypothetical protein n=1 Tax=Serratia marcescens TaxID=615 RepID=UPI003EC8A1CE
SDPLVPNQLRYQAALLADAGRILLLAVIGVNHFFAPAFQVVIKAPQCAAPGVAQRISLRR